MGSRRYCFDWLRCRNGLFWVRRCCLLFKLGNRRRDFKYRYGKSGRLWFMLKGCISKYGKQFEGFDDKARAEMEANAWSGNIRELQNTIERLKILAENNEIRLEDIPFGIRMPKSRVDQGDFSVDMPLDEVEKGHILRTLAYNHGNKTKTAQSLKITIKTLYNKLHKYGVIAPSGQPTAAAGLTTELSDQPRSTLDVDQSQV